MHPNHAFLLDFARSQRPAGRYLDFGCGAGEVVRSDEHVWGCDDFSLNERPAHERIRAVTNGEIPFPDAHFDVVFSNMVLEHVRELDTVLSEIARVLKPGGVTVHLFPSRGVWREGHCGIPFAHWLPYGWYLRAWRRLGFGVENGREPWEDYWLEYLRNAVHYRSEKEIYGAFGRAGFRVTRIEQAYIRHRLGMPVPLVGPWLVARLATIAVLGAPRPKV